MKKFSKILVVLLAFSALCIFAACNFTVDQVESIRFVNAPKANYTEEEAKNPPTAKDFSVAVKIVGQTGEIMFDLSNPALTVIGLKEGKLDMTVGTHTLVVIYQTVRCEFTYTVGGAVEAKPSIETATETKLKGLYEKLNTTSTAEVEINLKDYADNGVIDLSAYEWKPVTTKAALKIDGTNDGGRITIKGLTVTDYAADGGCGLIGTANHNVTISNVKFENTSIRSQKKEVAALVGKLSEAKVLTISNVEFNNINLYGLSCVASVVGRAYGCVLVDHVTVKNGSFLAYNPVSVVTDDGEGDKVAAIAGQLLRTLKDDEKQEIINCSVSATTISGTRCLGGLVGYLNNKATISNNTISSDVIISASVPGGMLITKGTRNVGGLIGTIASANLTMTGNKVETTQLYVNSNYEYSSCGKYIGGLRTDSKDTASFKITYITGESSKVCKNEDFTGLEFGAALTNAENAQKFIEAQAKEILKITEALDSVAPKA